MRPAIVETVKRLQEEEWFSHVGEPIFDNQVRRVSAWKEAIALSGSSAWRDLKLEMSNRYREKLAGQAIERFRKWNEIVREIKPITNALVAERCGPVVKANNLPKEFEDTVRWDILGVALEAEFQDVIPPGFYAGNAYWYTIGHFPCGWDGTPLEKGGHLLVF